MPTTRLPRGLTRTAKGWRITIKRKGHPTFRKRFPPATAQPFVEQYLANMRRSLFAGRATSGAGRFERDVERYIQSYFSSRPGREERERHLKLWVDALGRDTWRTAITRDDVSRVLQNWRSSGLTGETCNKRRSALLAFFNTLDGKGSVNPVRDVSKFRVVAPLPRGLDYGLIKRALKALPKCRSRARLKVMAFTGARPIQVRRLQPADWDDKAHTLLLRSTDKGRGTKAHTIPLSAQAQQAMREFEDTDAWGTFASAPIGRMWKKAAVAVGLPADVRVYDLRHSFGTQIYRSTGDVHITKALLGHSSFAMTERYTLAAVPARQTQAIAAFEAAVSGAKGSTPSAHLSKRLTK